MKPVKTETSNVTFDDKDDGKVYYDWFMLTQIKDHYAMFTLY